MATKAAAPKKEEIVKKTKVAIRFYTDSATIFRGENLPFFSDRIETSIDWLVKNGFKVEEIEVIGDKPEYWNKTFAPDPVPEEVAPEAAIV